MRTDIHEAEQRVQQRRRLAAFSAEFAESEHPRNPDGTFRTKAQIIAEEAVRNNENVGVVARRMGIPIRELSAIRGEVADHVERLKKIANQPSPARMLAMTKQALRNPDSLNGKITSIIPEEMSRDVVRNIRAGDSRSKNGGRTSVEADVGPLASIMLPISQFTPDHLKFIRESTSPDRVKRYAEEKPDAPIYASMNRKGSLVLNDGGHRLMAAVARGDTHIHALVPVTDIDGLKSRQPFASTDEFSIRKSPWANQWIFRDPKTGEEIGEITLEQREDGNYHTANVLVWPPFQRRGYATAMYDNAARWVRDQGKKFYVSNDRTTAAKRLHKSFSNISPDGEIKPLDAVRES